MKPAWDQLGDKFAASSSVLIADVDCTVEKDLCANFEVKGYPTIKYFKDGDMSGEDYKGGRDFDSLEKFVKETLEVLCDIADPSGCDEKEQKYITAWTAKSAEDVEKQAVRLTGMLGKSMKAELKAWVSKRLNILKQIQASGGKTEL